MGDLGWQVEMERLGWPVDFVSLPPQQGGWRKVRRVSSESHTE